MVNCRNLTSHSALAISTNSELCSQVLGSRAARHENTLHAHLAPVIWPAQAPANHGGWLAGNHGGWLAPSELHAPMAYSFLHPQPTCLAMAPPRIIAAMTSAAMDSKQVRPASRAVAHIVAHEVGNHGRVAAGSTQAVQAASEYPASEPPQSTPRAYPFSAFLSFRQHSGAGVRWCCNLGSWRAGAGAFRPAL